MILFRLIWLISLMLSVMSIVTLVSLYIRRLIIHARMRVQAARRAAMQDEIYRYLADPAGGVPTFAKSVVDQRIVLGLVTEMMRGVTGPMRDQLVALLESAIDQHRIARALREAGPADRAKFAARLAWSKSPEIHAALYAALDDPEPAVILSAANSLIAAGQPLSLIDLVPKLEARDMLGHRAVRDIFRKVAPNNAAALLALIEDKNPAVVVLAIDALVRTPPPSALRRLARLARTHETVDVRASALRTLGLIGNAEAAQVVLGALGDPAWEVKAQAAIAAGRLRLSEALPKLAEVMREPNWWVQLRSAQALVKLGDAGVAVVEGFRSEPALASIIDFALAERHSA